jgi:hypothetical protein
MKSINARTTFKLVLSLSWLIALAVLKSGYAGDYYIYQDPNGKLIISNYAPPQGSSVIKKETLSEVTDQQIIESQLRENRVALDNRIASLERTVGELTENLRAQSEIMDNLPEGYGETNIAVGVTQPPIMVARPLRKRLNQPTNFEHNLPKAKNRPLAPAARWRSGGKPG